MTAQPVREDAPRLGRRMARFNRAVFNNVVVHVAGFLPGLGIVIHVGRRSRRVYRTPVIVFRTPVGFRIALTYGPDADWVRNVVAHGGARLVTQRREYELGAPAVVQDPELHHIPRFMHAPLRLLRVADFLDLRRALPPDRPAEGGQPPVNELDR